MLKEFDELWSRSDAVIGLFVGWEVLSQNRNMEARLFMFVQEAFEGRTAKLDQDQDLVLYGKASSIGLAI